MTTAERTGSAPPAAGPGDRSAATDREHHDRSALRAVAVPTEHGGWSLTLEPVLLGLVVAWSWPGLALGAAAVLAFLARTPLKLVLVDRWRHRWLDRTRLALRVAAIQLVAIGALVAAAAFGGDGRFWIPVAVAAPMIAIELWFDMRSRSRRLLPELAGTIGISSSVAAITLANGSSAALAIGLWCVVAARGAAAVPYVRTQVLRRHGRPHHRWHSDLAQLGAVAAVSAAAATTAIPLAPLLAVGAVAAVHLVAVRLRPRPPTVIGVQQTMFGLTVIAVTAASVLAG